MASSSGLFLRHTVQEITVNMTRMENYAVPRTKASTTVGKLRHPPLKTTGPIGMILSVSTKKTAFWEMP